MIDNKYKDRFIAVADEKDIHALDEAVVKFATVTFKYRSPKPAIHHLLKEVQELSEEPYDLEEMADCLLILLHIVSLAGFTISDLLEKAWEKYWKNKRRKWGKPDENGVIEHVRKE